MKDYQLRDVPGPVMSEQMSLPLQTKQEGASGDNDSADLLFPFEIRPPGRCCTHLNFKQHPQPPTTIATSQQLPAK